MLNCTYEIQNLCKLLRWSLSRQKVLAVVMLCDCLGSLSYLYLDPPGLFWTSTINLAPNGCPAQHQQQVKSGHQIGQMIGFSPLYPPPTPPNTSKALLSAGQSLVKTLRLSLFHDWLGRVLKKKQKNSPGNSSPGPLNPPLPSTSFFPIRTVVGQDTSQSSKVCRFG